MPGPVKVLVVDDSALIRRMVVSILEADQGIQVVGYARNGAEALQKVAQQKPDVVTLDVEMPVMDGFSFMERLACCPTVAVVMFSSATVAGAEATFRALELGAVDFILKPTDRPGLEALAQELPLKVKAAARAVVGRLLAVKGRPRETKDLVSWSGSRPELVAIGISTGGPGALQKLLTDLPGDLPVPLTIVQHMPRGFTRPLAERLDHLSPLEVREAAHGDVLRPGTAFIAPAGHQMEIERQGNRLVARINDNLMVDTPFRPSVDVLFHAVAATCGQRSLAVIMTGMGRDGVKGMKAIKEAGGRTLSEAEESCVVYGMPRAAVEAGVVDRVEPLSRLASTIKEVFFGPRG